jgi:hypothetical protein
MRVKVAVDVARKFGSDDPQVTLVGERKQPRALKHYVEVFLRS